MCGLPPDLILPTHSNIAGAAGLTLRKRLVDNFIYFLIAVFPFSLSERYQKQHRPLNLKDFQSISNAGKSETRSPDSMVTSPMLRCLPSATSTQAIFVLRRIR
jgi:hypothetical protein